MRSLRSSRGASSVLLILGMASIGAVIGFTTLALVVNKDRIAGALNQDVPAALAGSAVVAAESLSDEELANLIDDMAGHPDDPQLPNDTLGASDNVLSATDPREIAQLLKLAQPYAKANSNKPRFLFALGRAALMHGYDKLGVELLETAARNNSGAAYAYLGFLAENNDEVDQAIAHLRKALTLGFDSAAVHDSLSYLSDDDLEDEESPDLVEPTEHFDPGEFNQPAIISALYSQDTQRLKSEGGMHVLLYISTIHNTLWQDNILFITESPELLLELDPTIATRASVRLQSSSDLIMESTQIGLGSLWEGFKAMANARQSGASITEEVAQFGAAASKAPAQLEIIKQQAVQDGRRLALLYDADPEEFRRIYAGIKQFVL